MRYLHGFLFTAALAVSATGAAAQRADPAAQRSDPGAQRADPAAQTTSSKLSTVLAALSQSVTQSTSSAQRAGGAQPLSLDSASKPVKDAIQGGWLRLNASQEVQVYVLMTEVTDATVGQLTAAGATIEIRDASRRRVQARVPVSLLQAVSQLSVVNAVRLPTYARRRTGAVTSEGDVILYADNVRSQLLL
ncbi:MAG TPA: hypothetical protein VG222_00220, partial [Vicinamibacterales bacterium]|nr:hypothetical protein [Vicinamibacterales bacterium]